MANLMDYLDWRGDLTLSAAPFNEVDGLILAELSFINFEGLVPPPELGRGVRLRDAAERYFARNAGKVIEMGVLVPDKIPAMLCAMAKSDRFGNMLLNAFEERIDLQQEQQFAAVSIELGDGSVYLSFRGTDDTLIGWKEDLNMGFLTETPSQKHAVSYVERVAQQYGDKALRLGGHSKGGNLSVYSAAKCTESVQKRILAVYNNDGPGFAFDLSLTEGHKRIAHRIHTIVPQSSIIGMLMEHEKDVQVVYSTLEGIAQHDGFSWEVKGTTFIHLDDFSREGKLLEETISTWADELSPQQREDLADAFYEMLSATGAETLSDLNAEKAKSAVSMLKTYTKLDAQTRRAFSEAILQLVKLGTKNVLEEQRAEDEKKMQQLRQTVEERLKKLLERKQ